MLMNVKDIEGSIKNYLSTHDSSTLKEIHDRVSNLQGQTEQVLESVRVSGILILVDSHTMLIPLIRILMKNSTMLNTTAC